MRQKYDDKTVDKTVNATYAPMGANLERPIGNKAAKAALFKKVKLEGGVSQFDSGRLASHEKISAGIERSAIAMEEKVRLAKQNIRLEAIKTMQALGMNEMAKEEMKKLAAQLEEATETPTIGKGQ